MITDEELVQAVVLTAELLGQQLSAGAAKMLLADLDGYEPGMVLRALARLRKEGGRLTTNDILKRLDDGRPGPDEAWAMLPFDEASTVVWTDEIAEAWGIAKPLLDSRDKAGAQRAFREAYTRKVMEAREQRKPARWWVSLGHDKGGREGPVMETVRMGRLGMDQAVNLLPHGDGARSQPSQLSQLSQIVDSMMARLTA